MEEINFSRVMSQAEVEVRKIFDKKRKVLGKNEKNKKIIKTDGFLSSSDRHIGEMVIPKKGSPFFAVYNKDTNHLTYRDKIETDNKIYFPDRGDPLIVGNIVKIPKSVGEYHSLNKLKEDLREYVCKYVDIANEVDREIIITYILLTWVYDRFSAIPYLRILGDYGTGKSRLLKVLNVCYKSLSTVGLASAAPIFRLINQFGCTLLIDELELSSKADRNEDIKEILRAGNIYGGVVARCDSDTHNVKGYKVFSPKIIGSRKPTNDDALESRLISIRMKQNRHETVKIQLNREEFDTDSDLIRSKLLSYRLKNYYDIDTEAYIPYVNDEVSSRLNEMIAPLICISRNDKEFIEALLKRANEKNEQMKEDKSMSFDAEIIKAIYMVHIEGKGDPLVQEIADRINDDYKKNYSPRFIGNVIRDNFKLKTRHTRDGNVVIYKEERVLRLIKEYGIDEITETKSISEYGKISNAIKRESRKLRNRR